MDTANKEPTTKAPNFGTFFKPEGPNRLLIKERTKKPRIVLISPPVVGSDTQIRKASPPIGMACLAAVLLQNGFEDVLLVDAALEGYSNVRPLDDDPTFIKFGLTDAEIVKRVADFKADIVGISSLFSALTECAFGVANAIRAAFPDMPIMMGGNHASYMASEIMADVPAIDWILSGEADYTFTDFVRKYFGGENFYEVPGLVWRGKDGPLKNPKGPMISDMDSLPEPAYHLYDMEKYFEIDMPHNPFTVSPRVGTLMTSRGCPEKCYFCTSPNYAGRSFRAMSAKRTIQVVKNLVDRYGIKELQILDDTFTTNWRRVVDIMEGIAPLGLRVCFPNSIRADYPRMRDARLTMFKAMKKGGVFQFGLGIEHGDQEFLDKVLLKNLDLSEVTATIELAHEAGIFVHANFILGFPFETAKNRETSINFAKSLDADSFGISLAAPLPGTPLWEIVKTNNLFAPGFNVNRMTLAKVNIIPHDISMEDLYNLVDSTCRELNETAQAKRPAQAIEKARLFKDKRKTADGDRKFHFAKYLYDHIA